MAGAACALLAIPGGAALADVGAGDTPAEAPPTAKHEARLAAGDALAASRRAQLGPRTVVEATRAATAAGPSVRQQLAAARTDALAEKYTPAYARSYAKSYMKQKYGWGESEFRALSQLWTRESNWDFRAENPSSGAYGIPQSLPASKMASEGRDWRTNPEPQIRWGLKYIRSTYGSPSATIAFWNANHWY